MNVAFVPGGEPQHSALHKQPPASHVGRPHLSHPPRLQVTRTVSASSSDLLPHSSSDVLPERVRPKGEPTEEPDGGRRE